MVLDEQAKEYIRTVVGSYNVVTNHRADSDRTGVTQIQTASERFFVKIYSRSSHWNREVYAYKNWTKDIEPFAPSLIDAFQTENQCGIIISPLVGKTVNEWNLQDEEKLAIIYYEAGRLFRKMQNGKSGEFFGFINADGTPQKGAETDTVTYVSACIEMFARDVYAHGHITPSLMPIIHKAINDCTIFAGETPSLTHWDLSPNNWMTDKSGNFTGFMDFENTLWGISLDSFGVITQRYTFDNPRLTASFFEGYGLTFDEVTKKKLYLINMKMALANIHSGIPRWQDCGNRWIREHLREGRAFWLAEKT